MTSAAPQRFYRVVRANPPSEEDFKSNHAQGKKRRRYEGEDEWRGISVFATEDGARRVALQFGLGQYIAVLRIPPGAPIRHDTPSASGHCNLWGEPVDLVGYVESVMPV